MDSYFNAFPIIYTADLAKTLGFYRDLLGFRETFRFPTDGDPAFVALTLGGGGSLALAEAADGQPGAHGLPLHPGDRGSFELCLYTQDVDQSITTLRAQARLGSTGGPCR